MFFKRKKIQFFCQLPEVQERYPIVPAQDTKFNWMKETVQNYKSMDAEYGKYQSITSSVKCPGIRPSMTLGYVLRSWFDLTIRTTEDPNHFEYFINSNIYTYLKQRNYDRKLISWFSSKDKNHSIPIAENDLQEFIKITTPWYVKVPKGYKLLIMPVPYPDDPSFSSVHGVLDSKEQYPLHCIIKCHRRPGETFIPAGTPLCHLVPIKDDGISLEINGWSDDNQKQELHNDYRANHCFTPKIK